jgi:hypothetical protein
VQESPRPLNNPQIAKTFIVRNMESDSVCDTLIDRDIVLGAGRSDNFTVL